MTHYIELKNKYNELKSVDQTIQFGGKKNDINFDKLKILTKHPDFYQMVRDKYIRRFPLGEKLLDDIIQLVRNKEDMCIQEMIDLKTAKRKTADIFEKIRSFMDIWRRLEIEFIIYFPEKYIEYWQLCGVYENWIPKDIIL